MSLNGMLCLQNIFRYCHLSVHEVSYGLAKIDPIKQHLLYHQKKTIF
jgi:hypothetical protein